MINSEKKDVILNALIERRGIQHLVDVASKTLNNPLFIYDLGGKVLSKSKWEEEPKIWDILLPGGNLQACHLQKTEEAGIYQYLIENDAPIFGSLGFFPNRFLGCRIRDKGSAIGIATLVEMNPITDEDVELLIIVCKAVLFEMLYYERTAMQTIPYFSLLKDILENNINAETYRERSRAIHFCPPESMRLIAVGYQDYVNNLSTYFFREAIVASLPSCYCIVYNNLILIVIEEKYYTPITLSSIQACFSEAKIWVGVSQKFHTIHEMPSMYEQVLAICNIRTKLQIKNKIISYDDIVLYHFFEEAAKEQDLQKFTHPLLKLIEGYDIKNGTCFLQSIEMYLECGRNMQKAADRMNVHKNTLYYRLKRAEELFSFQINDENICFLLQFSLRMKRVF